ncbi:MAG: hypothetical protein JSS33_04710 [Proteobacteria bacterium]|nr:hypothetical protein [Pseudomonadota bacterium]
MNRHACLTTLVSGAALLCANGAGAAGTADNISDLLTKIGSVSATPTQAEYSRELQKSVNQAAVLAVARDCAQTKGAKAPATFTLVGMMRIDGTLTSTFAAPDNAFGTCMASNMTDTHFPLPPGDGHGWPVAIQFDAKTGKAIYVAGDKQSAMPKYSWSANWVHTPLPALPAHLSKRCTVGVWLSLGKNGRVKSAELGDSECPEAFNAAVVDAASQWLGMSKEKAATRDSMDLKVSFTAGPVDMRVAP